MTIYVDELRDYQDLMRAPVPGLWCHMVTDRDIEELHAFARRLTISRFRFQNHPRHPHYDLTPGERARAVLHGAVEVSTRDLRKILQNR